MATVERFDCTKMINSTFVSSFIQLSREVLVACLPLLVNHLTAKSHVVHSYAANSLEKLFTLKSPGGGAPYVILVFSFLRYLLMLLINSRYQ